MHAIDAEDSFDPPGPGSWTLDASHLPTPATPYMRAVIEGIADGARSSFARYGLPIANVEIAWVQGRVYFRMRGVGEPSRAMPFAPPAPVVWLLSRAHPEFRRRTAAAEQTLAERRWRADARRWRDEWRPRLLADLERLADVEVDRLADDALVDHVEELAAFGREGARLHFELVPAHFVPLGRLLLAAEARGIAPEEVLRGLSGRSPASAAPLAALREVADHLQAAGVRPRSIDELRAASPAAAASFDRYVRRHAWRPIGSTDVDAATLAEHPDLLLRSVLAVLDDDEPRAEMVESLEGELAELAAEARETFGLRDDNVDLTEFWPTGLARRALLEAGRRLAERGGVSDQDHVFEAAPDELRSLFDGGAPTADELAERAGKRARQATLEAPATLGPEQGPPPLGAMPAALRDIAGALMAGFNLAELPVSHPPLTGTGIGTVAYKGRAVVAEHALAAVDRLEHGDVLVVSYTTPAANVVLPLLGGLVTEEGGPFCHAAIVANEYRIPAVVGAKEATSRVADGDVVEVDPVAGTVRVIS